MESSDSGAVDCGVGSIVWVRRRNGSWWPGQILGPEDLSASHLTSPRSGTPVKLLGREDASVDWYNLEKSKRVKAFRCGEFDDCIERAECSQGMPTKKREKYARREDAILHALELEKQMKKQEKLGVISGAEQMGTIYRARRSRCLYLAADSSDSVDYKGSPGQIGMTSSQIGGEHTHHGTLTEEGGSAFMEEDECDSSETGTAESEADSSETEPDIDEDMTTCSEVGQDAEEHESTSSEELDEFAISEYMPHLMSRDPTNSESVSKWQLKGKRNSRNLMKRPYGVYSDCSQLRYKTSRPSLSYYSNNFVDDLDDTDFSGKNFRAQISGRDGGYAMALRVASNGRSKVLHSVNDLDGCTWDDQPSYRGFWDMKGFPPLYDNRHSFGGRLRSMWFDVELKVQASYQKEPVPIVSVLSKLDGKAIIGHPIQIEALQDGSTDSLLSTIDDLSNELIDAEGNTALPPAWRTARRTANFRVPRPHLLLSSSAELADDSHFLYQESKQEPKKLNVGHFSHKASQTRKGALHVNRPSTDKKFLKTAPKRVSLSSTQKTRTLSSLAVEQKFGNKLVVDRNSCSKDGLMKPESSGPPTVACIPVRLVFSRLLEKINRPPKAAALLNTGVEKNSNC